MNLLLLTPDFPPAPGGIQVVSHRLAANLPGINVRVLALGEHRAAEFDAEQGFRVVRTTSPILPHQLRVALLNSRGLVEGLRFRPDVVLCMHIVASPAGAALRRLMSVPVVQYLHADEMRARPGLTRWALARAQAIVAVSGHTEALALRAGADPSHTWRVPNGVDIPATMSAERAGPPTVVTVGRLTQRYKGHDVMLRALPLIRDRVPEARWVVVGDGPLRPELERQAADAGLAGAVTFVGTVSDAERDRWLDTARVFAMPSRLPPGGSGGEGFGIAFLEASAHGLPVVAGNVGGALDAVRHDRTGLLVEPTDPRAVANAIAGLLLDPSRGRALGSAGIEWSREFAWDKIGRRVEDILLAVAR